MAIKSKNYVIRVLWIIGILVIVLLASSIYRNTFRDIDYNTQVKPILNKHCISCHGGVKQNAGFSLISRSNALEVTESGLPAIIPGDIKNSEFIRRLTTDDLDERMPQGSDPLSEKEIIILKNWVKQGVKWGVHWAYNPLKKQDNEKPRSLLTVLSSESNMTPRSIDYFIQDKLVELGLKQNSKAERSELLRRASFDIVGLPPSLELIKKYVESEEIDFEEVVDILLNSNSFGENWASMWLDIARYADSKGFERDQNRSIWRYRDYVISSFNTDKPYNQFIIEQMAGDLLNNPTDEELVATGFHRNTSTNDEGGTDNEEYRIKAVMDRVSTTWEGLLGTTMACVQCHGHPYDPFPHKEFYQSMAFLNNTRDADTNPDYPVLYFLDTLSQQKLDDLTEWIQLVDTKQKSQEIEKFVRTVQPVIYSIEADQYVNSALYDTKYLGLRKDGVARIPNVPLTQIEVLLMRAYTTQYGGKLFVHIDYPQGEVIAETNLKKSTEGYEIIEIPIKEVSGNHDIFLEYQNPSLDLEDSPGIMMDWYYLSQNFPGKTDIKHRFYKREYYDLLESKHDHTLIMTENPDSRKRRTHVFDRGNWQIHKEEVFPKVPEVLPQINSTSDPDRLAFAKWIVDEGNPLTSRTFVNRVWEQIFGQGIALTVEDLGSQGVPPTHLELLDWMAYTWMYEDEWSIKDLIKKILLSETYQQSSITSTESQAKDPSNQYLSRSPRIRLSAEQVRDQALMVSGLLSNKMYGRPVMPPQPENVWQTPYNTESWIRSEGEDQYRRAIYTMIKRSALYPSMETFDLSARQVCVSRRIRTNTPLQALVTLNDPVFVEASEHLAQRMKNEGGGELKDQISFAYKLAMGKDIADDKGLVLQNLYKRSLTSFKSQNDDKYLNAEMDALTTVANAVLNLDEFLNK